MNVKQCHYIGNNCLYSTQDTAVADIFALATLEIAFMTGKETNQFGPNTKVSPNHVLK